MSEAVEEVSFRQTFWFLPLVYNILALLLAAITLAVDYSVTKDIPLAGLILMPLDLAIQIMASLAGAILTMTTITFSMIMIVLTTYSAQFSPRVLQTFIADRVTQHVLAIFTSGFTFSLLSLLFMNKNNVSGVVATPTVAVIWGLTAIASFIYFIHHTATWVQVNNLIGFLTSEAKKTIVRVTDRDIDEQRTALLEDDSKAMERNDGTPVYATASGYIIYIELQALFRLAKRQNSSVRMDIHIGAYVMDGLRIMTVWGEGEDKQADYQACVHYGDEPKDWQDIEFALRKLAEIGMRALSPGINDPHTAATCIDRMTPLLTMLAKRDQRVSAFYDEDGKLRLLTRDYRFEDYLHYALHGMRHHGRSDVIVIGAILDSLALIAKAGPVACHPTLWEFGADAVAGFSQPRIMASDRRHLLDHFKPLAEATGLTSEYEQQQMLQVEAARADGI